MKLHPNFIKILVKEILNKNNTISFQENPDIIQLSIKVSESSWDNKSFTIIPQGDNLILGKRYGEMIGLSGQQSKDVLTALNKRKSFFDCDINNKTFYEGFEKQMLDMEIEEQLGGSDEDQSNIKKD
jgi:hypothetical protein